MAVLVATTCEMIWRIFGWITAVLIVSCLYANLLRHQEPDPTSFPFFLMCGSLWLVGLGFPFLFAALIRLAFG